MDNTIPTSPTNQWMDIGMPYYQQTDFGIANPYDQCFSDSTIITTSTTQNTIDQHQYSSTLSPENSSQIAGNDDIHELSPKTSKGKPIRRRSRASKKTPTTLVNTSITNFRAAVQQYTGCDHTSPIFKNQKGPINLSFGPSTDDVQTEFFGSNLVGEGSRNYGYYSNYEDQTERSKDKLQQDQESGTSPSAAYSNSGNSKLSVDAGTLQILLLNPQNGRRAHLRTTQTHFPFSKISSNINRSQLLIRATSQHSNQGSGSGDQLPRTTAKLNSNWVKPIWGFVSNNFLPLALIGGVALGLVNPTLGCLADRYYLSKISTFGIFIISGLTLRSDEIGAAAEAWPVGIFGLVSILFFTPLFSKIIMLLKLQPQEFVTGLAIFSCMPTTLSSGVALTRLAGGNSALALAMTLISNLLGILIVPFSISKLIAAGVGVSVPAEQLFRSLVFTLLVPLIIGKALRECFKSVAEFSDRNRKLLAMMSSLLLSLAPFIQVSRSRSLLLLVKPEVFLLAVVLGVLLHLILFAFNALALTLLSTTSTSFSKKENISALLFVASQKTLPVMVAVVEQLGNALGESGLLVLPCIAAHLNQIILDSLLVNFWLQKGRTDNLKTA